MDSPFQGQSTTTATTTMTVEKANLTLNQYRKSGKFCDFELHVGEKVFKVHKVVLAASSGYFDVMFNNKENFIENEENKINLSEDVDPQTCETLLTYIYTGEITVNANNVQDIARISNMFELMELVEHCSTFLEKSISKNNCIGILRFADFYGFPQLYYTTKRYVEYHFAEVSSEEEFLELTPKLLKQFLRSESLSIDHETQVLIGTLDWIMKDQNDRLQYLEEFINLIRMPLISPVQLKKCIAKYTLPAIADALAPYLKSQSSGAKLPQPAPSSHEPMEEKDLSYSLIRHQARMCSRRRVYIIGGLKHVSNDRQMSNTLNTMVKLDLHTGTWDASASFGYQRSSHCVVNFQGKIFLIGGECDSLILDTVQVFDPDTATGEATWKEVARLTTPRSAFGACVYKNNILGHCSGHTIERYDPDTEEWEICGTMPQSLQGMQVVEYDGLIYIIGGRSPAQGYNSLNTLLCYSPETGEFKELAPMNSARSDFGCAVLHGHIYVIGGLDSNNDPLTTVEQYNITENKWSFLSPLKTRRSSMCATAINNLIYTFGGRQVNAPRCLRDVTIYDPSLDQWFPCNQMPQSRTDAAVVLI
ncbi:hypothetical protein TYRP_008253 [Tyrophagus putrescentiae]|nr:hypothetical protein TYRP_008253 [Tyrophagus putrescentiae]